MKRRFYPKGHIGPHQAIIILAKARYPTRWQEDAMSAAEWKIWNTEHELYGHLFTGDILRHEVDWKSHSTIDRWCDYSEAFDDIRKALDGGSLTARFRDIDGRWDHIQQDSWAIDAAEEVLLSGVVDAAGVEPGRTVLLSVKELAAAFPVLTPQTASQCVEPGMGGKPALALAAVKALWPDGIPAGLSAKVRNQKVAKWLADQGHGSISARSVVSALKLARSS